MEREPIVIQCDGCDKIIVGLDFIMHCLIYIIPASKWRMGDCPMATHLIKQTKGTPKINPLKASKKKMKGNIK